ncbi:zinc finger CCCH domain-containing protein 9-like [Tasmannia lanceolata]|uniref:zinc finger CCCH domain-containing protein 9-like n=1 Tax=Tasmannia lanceolata TaxID=3420 RepID=UPI0040629F43
MENDIIDLQLSELTSSYEELFQRYEYCVSVLREKQAEADALRLDNEKLQFAILQLRNRLDIISMGQEAPLDLVLNSMSLIHDGNPADLTRHYGASSSRAQPQGATKTEICNNWMKFGGCPYGIRCHFAHGPQELLPIERDSKYKTKVCLNVLAGKTPYGDRRLYLHST